MAKGAVAKEVIFQTILKTFEGSFMYNNGKELRIPYEEESGEVQIKVTLTCAKDNVNPEGDVIERAAVASETVPSPSFPTPSKTLVEPTAEEKQNVEDLLKALGLE